MKHSYSIETLTHLRCYKCSHWWSIGGTPFDREWFCPWCGHKAEVETMVQPREQDNLKKLVKFIEESQSNGRNVLTLDTLDELIDQLSPED